LKSSNHRGRDWTAKAEVRHNNGRTLRFFNVEGIPEKFDSRDDAEQYLVEAAKKLIVSLTYTINRSLPRDPINRLLFLFSKQRL
jgi:hypothetical protein